ncbi:MAG: hypothetical protein WEB59_13550 [Thermoanaerobaculia bacterium]
MVLPRLGMGLVLGFLLLPARDCGEGAGTRNSAAAPPAASAVEAPAAPAPAPAPDAFATSVRPVLQSRCAPCHEPGGQMYERLPFDDSRVIAAHPEGILKRLKAGEREAVEKWLASLPPGP